MRSVPLLTTGEILRRHAASFVVAFVTLTASMLALYARRQIPGLSARGAPAGSIAETLLFSVPFLAAMTIPMAVLIAVLRELTRLGAEGALDLARRMRGGVRRLVVSLVAGAVAIAVLEFVVAAEIVPRANERLLSLIGAEHASANDSRASPRAMTIGALRAALRDERPTGALELERAARYEVEIQKKLALAAACVVMAVIGVAVALRAPRGGAPLVIGASCVVFGAYYVLLVTGEDLANRLIISPVVGMWAANALLLCAALLALAWRPTTLAPSGRGAAALGR